MENGGDGLKGGYICGVTFGATEIFELREAAKKQAFTG